MSLGRVASRRGESEVFLKRGKKSSGEKRFVTTKTRLLWREQIGYGGEVSAPTSTPAPGWSRVPQEKEGWGGISGEKN